MEGKWGNFCFIAICEEQKFTNEIVANKLNLAINVKL